MQSMELASSIPNDIKFNAELDFVNQLGYDEYIIYLIEQNFLEDEKFLDFINYLNYFTTPEYSRFLRSSKTIFYLQNLQNETFRRNLTGQVTIGEGNSTESHTYIQSIQYNNMQAQVSQNYFEEREKAVESNNQEQINNKE